MSTISYLGGGQTAETTSSFVGYRGCSNAMTVPTTGNLDYDGNKPVLIQNIRAYASGRTNSANIRFEVGTKYTPYFDVAADTSAQRTPYQTLNGYFANGGTQTFRIKNSSLDDYFYYGKGGSGTIIAINADNTSAGTLTTTDGLTGDFSWVTVPGKPTAVTVSQPSLSTPVIRVSWTAPANNGGSTLTGYLIQWSDDNFATVLGSIETSTTATTRDITLLAGQTLKFRVAAKNGVTIYGTSSIDGTQTFSAVSTASSSIFVQQVVSLDGWTTVGALPSGWTRVITREPVAGMPGFGVNGVALRVKTTSTNTGTVSLGSLTMRKTLYNFEPGKIYQIYFNSELGPFKDNASLPLDTYRWEVAGLATGTAWTVPDKLNMDKNMNILEFTATSTEHQLVLKLYDSISGAMASGLKEDTIFPYITVARKWEPAEYFIGSNTYKGPLTDHFDLTMRSVKGAWWVNKNDFTQFIYKFDDLTPIAKFTDVQNDGNLHYIDIKREFSTKKLINDVVVKNLGIKPAARKPSEAEEYVTLWNVRDDATGNIYGTRRLEVATNIWQADYDKNCLYNPRVDKDITYWNKYGSATSFSLKRINIAKAGTGATNFLTSGASGPQGSKYALCVQGIVQATLYPFATGMEGKAGSEDDQEGFPIEVVDSNDLPLYYTASVYVRAGIGNSGTSATSQIWIRWYDKKGTAIGNSTLSTAVSTATGAWVKNTISGVEPPAGTAFAQVRMRINNSFASGVGRTWYFTNASLLESEWDESIYFDGNTKDTEDYLYEWEDQPYKSKSILYENNLSAYANDILLQGAFPEEEVVAIQWNAQEDLELVNKLDIGSKIQISFDGLTYDYRIVGLDHEIEPERWLITIKVQKLVEEV